MSTKSPRSIECAHINEGAMEGHQANEMITCLLRIHDDFDDFSSISLFFVQWFGLSQN